MNDEPNVFELVDECGEVIPDNMEVSQTQVRVVDTSSDYNPLCTGCFYQTEVTIDGYETTRARLNEIGEQFKEIYPDLERRFQTAKTEGNATVLNQIRAFKRAHQKRVLAAEQENK